MISHKYKIIYIHIPKCAGTSIENLFGAHPFDNRKPNYNVLTGWCPKRKIYLQHATAEELLNLGLIDINTWSSYYKFAIVRDPWSRSYSDYFWMRKETGIKDSFFNYLNKKGKYKPIFDKIDPLKYRGDHLLPQFDFICIDNKIVVDKICKFENLFEDFKDIQYYLNSNKFDRIPHKQKGNNKNFPHYSLFYNNKTKNLIKKIYNNDIKLFEYHYENHNIYYSFITKIIYLFKSFYYQNNFQL